MSALRVFSLAAGVVLVFAYAGPVKAEEAAGARSMVVEEVLVTARKREESLQEVPVAVSAFSQEQIEDQTIQEFIDIEGQVPGVFISQTQHDPSIAAIAIRGQQQPDFLLTNDSAVGAYVDNVNLPRQSGLNANLFDIERIEVLKGPQGTLYGRNTTGGAINVISRKADYDGTHGYLKASYGNENFTQISGALNIPFSETAAARIAAQKTDQDGWGESRFTGDDLYDQDEIFLRGSLVLDPSERVNIQLQADYMDLDEGGAIEKLTQPGGNFINGLPDTTSLAAGVELSGAPVDFANYVDYVNSGYAAMAAYVDGELLKTDADADVFSKATLWGGGLTISVDVTDAIELRSITGYRNWETAQLLDLDGTPFKLLHPLLAVDADFFSQELQLAGVNDRLNWVVGGYYSRENGIDGSTTIAVSSINPTTNITRGEVTNTSWALFGQATYAVTDRVNITGGLRWTEEKKELTNMNRLAFGDLITSSTASTVEDAVANAFIIRCRVPPGDIPVDQCAVDSSDTFNDPSWLISVDYRVNDQVMIYASNARSWRGGGQNLRADGADLAAAQPFRPETATSYEAGLKGDFADGLMRLNAAAYYVDYEDIQRTIIVPGSESGSVVTVLTNAAKAEISGFEAEAWLNPSETLSFFATVGYLDFKYEDFESFAQDGVTIVDRSDEGVPLPDWQFSLSARYDAAIGANELGIQVDYLWTEKFSTDSTSARQDAVTRDAGGRLNARADWLFGNDFTLSLWGKNLTDEEFIAASTDFTGNLGPTITVVGRPRSFGLTLSKTFGNE